jgi:hemoglobin-like flavoprotein
LSRSQLTKTSEKTMTQEDITKVHESFRTVESIKEQASKMFYDRLFDIDPRARALFAHSNLVEQGNKLMAALAFVVASLRQPHAMLGTLRALAVRHAGYGVTDAHYVSVGKALMWTLEEGLGEAWTPQLWAAWAEVYETVSRVMINAAREVRLGPCIAVA